MTGQHDLIIAAVVFAAVIVARLAWAEIVSEQMERAASFAYAEGRQAGAQEERARGKRIDHRLVEAVGRGELETRVLALCPDGKGRPVEYGHVKEIPDERDCSCGQRHYYSGDDCDVTFRATSQDPQEPQR